MVIQYAGIVTAEMYIIINIWVNLNWEWREVFLHGLRSKRFYPSVAVTPAPVQVFTLRPLVQSFENFSPYPCIWILWLIKVLYFTLLILQYFHEKAIFIYLKLPSSTWIYGSNVYILLLDWNYSDCGLLESRF